MTWQVEKCPPTITINNEWHLKMLMTNCRDLIADSNSGMKRINIKISENHYLSMQIVCAALCSPFWSKIRVQRKKGLSYVKRLAWCHGFNEANKTSIRFSKLKSHFSMFFFIFSRFIMFKGMEKTVRIISIMNNAVFTTPFTSIVNSSRMINVKDTLWRPRKGYSSLFHNYPSLVLSF
jgi:hypothetical protein